MSTAVFDGYALINDEVIIPPERFKEIRLYVDFPENFKGMLAVFLNDDLKEKGCSLLEELVLCEYPNKVEIRIFNNSKRSVYIAPNTDICTLITILEDEDSNEE